MLAYFGIALAVQMQQPHAAASSIVPVTSVARPPLPINENTTRAKAIVARMTNAEKASLLNGIKSSAYGNSHNGYYIGNIPAVPRLNIPSVNMQDASQGFRTIDKTMYGQVTSWPCSLAVASTWDTLLVNQWGAALGKEFRAKGANMILGPSLNVHRVAKGGRNAEYISGESGYLGAKLVPEYVLGVQSQKVMANIKHYVLNNQETNRNLVDSLVGDRALHEVYMAPFRAGALAGAASAMCSYNLVNGTHACGNGNTMNKDLKADLHWAGFITSDWGAVHADGYQAAGLDMDQPGTDKFFQPEKLESDQATLDDMAARVLTGLIMVDAFDNAVCVPTGAGECDHFLYEVNATSAAHADLARTIAATGASLLKNKNGVLPLGAAPSKGNRTTIAVVGDACNAQYNLQKMEAGWNVGNYFTMGGSGRVINPGSTNILDGITQRAGKSGAVVVTNPENADVIVTCGAAWSTEGNDRHSLLVDQDADIAKLVASATVPVVVLLTTPGSTVTASFDEGADAIVSMHLAGQATGLAWADVLFGDVNPSGRLAVTYPKSEGDAVEPCKELKCEYTEQLAVGYRGYEGKDVAYPFGHGLSYTSFEYSAVGWTAATAPHAGAGAARVAVGGTVSVNVKNTGNVAGAEVAQLYLTWPDSAQEPGAALRGFQKTSVLAPGASQLVEFVLGNEEVQVWDLVTSSFVVKSGGYIASVGASSRDLRVMHNFTV